jgi:hypothetical protein
MSSELDDVARSLFHGSIPNIWRKLAPDTLKTLGNWILYFLRRFSQYMQWVSAGQPRSWVRGSPGLPRVTPRAPVATAVKVHRGSRNVLRSTSISVSFCCVTLNALRTVYAVSTSVSW